EVYLANARALQTELEVLDRHLAERLLVIADRGFAVYHEGYSHFVQRYHLKQLGYVTFGPEQRPGARHLYRLRQQLATAQCLFTEPYYGTDAALALADELSLTLGELDPLGAGVDSYPELLESMAEDFLECLAP